jgi:peptidoglycan/LPS O-acetylase OafA/YrhL
MVVDYVDDVAAVLVPAVFLYVWVRWSTSTKWRRYYDTRAIFTLYGVIVLVTIWGVAARAHLLLSEWLPWVGAVAWVLILGAGVFLLVGYEVEQARARRRNREHARASLTENKPPS